MERPDIGQLTRTGVQMRLIATTQSMEEANRLSEQYEMQGFETRIMKKGRGQLALYEVWIGKNGPAIEFR
jgi:hypothetical protein